MTEPETYKHGYHLWILDDNGACVRTLKDILEHFGYQVTGFTKSSEFLKAVTKETPDLLILDLMMPEISGQEVLGAMVRMGVKHKISVLVLTAEPEWSAMVDAFDAGADDFIRKPYAVPELIGRVKANLRTHQLVKNITSQNQQLELLLTLSRNLNKHENVLRVVDRILQAVEDFDSVDRCYIMLDKEHWDGIGFSKQTRRNLITYSSDYLLSNRQELLTTEDDEEYAGLVEDYLTQQGLSVNDSKDFVLSIFPMRRLTKVVGFLVLTLLPKEETAGWLKDFIGILKNVIVTAFERHSLFLELEERNSQLQSTSKKIEHSRDFLKKLIDNSLDAILAYDMTGKIIIFSKASERILRYSPEAVVEKMNVDQIYPPGDRMNIGRKIAGPDFGGPGRLLPCRRYVISKDDEAIPVRLSAVAIYEKGEKIAIMVLMTDLRERLEIEEQLERTTMDLEDSRRKMVAAQLAGAAAHSLNQPLTTVFGYAELLKQAIKPSDRYYREITSIHAGASKMARIIRKIGEIRNYRTTKYLGETEIFVLESSEGIPVINLTTPPADE